jgi:hypothetical protein
VIEAVKGREVAKARPSKSGSARWPPPVDGDAGYLSGGHRRQQEAEGSRAAVSGLQALNPLTSSRLVM